MGGFSKSKSKSSSVDKGTDVWATQAPYLQGMYANANQVFNQQQGNVYTPGTMQTRQVVNPNYQAPGSYGMGNGMSNGIADYFLNSRGGRSNQPKYITESYMGEGSWSPGGQSSEMGQAKQDLNSMRDIYSKGLSSIDQSQGTYDNAERGFNQFLQPGVNPMSDVYKRQAGQAFNEEIMPGLRGDAMAVGGLGSSRAGIAQGLAGARVGQQLQDWNAQLYNEDANRAIGASQGLTQLGNARAGSSEMYNRNAEGVGGLAEMGLNLPWYALEKYQGLLGAPVIKDLGGSSKSKGSSFGASIASSSK